MKNTLFFPMHYLSVLTQSLRYYFFEIRGSLFFKIRYFTEKCFQYGIAVLNWKLSLMMPMPYFFNADYIIENNEGRFFIKHHTDFDYHIQPYYEASLLKYFDLKDGIFIDIGAHFWRYSIKIANSSKNVQVYCFEPNPATFQCLLKNIELNNLSSQIIPVHYGLSSSEWTVKFVNYVENTGSSKIITSKNQIQKSKKAAEVIHVNLTSLDRYIDQHKIDKSKIKLIKIDVEEHEYDVFQWMQWLLKASESLKIICEILSDKHLKTIESISKQFWLKTFKIDEFNYLFSK